ncbi:MAG: hypothetical protein WCR06_09905 [bacterium]
MHLKVPYNWDADLLQIYAGINHDPETRYRVCEVYASDQKAIIGTGRAPSSLPVRKGHYREHIGEAHRHGLRFSFVFNACSMAGREFSPETQSQFYAYLHELVDAGLDGLIITMPYLAHLVHRWFPALTISSSVNNQLTSVEKIAQLQASAPFSRIQFPFTRARDFNLFREAAARFPEYDRIALVNESCLPDCAFQRFHQDYYNFGDVRDGAIDYYHLCCALQKLEDPLNVLKAQWVMPEDLHHLADAGITTVKLAGRDRKDNLWLTELVASYARGRSCGNVYRFVEKSGLLDPEWSRLLGADLTPCHYQVDSAKLNGFIEGFVRGDLPCVRNKSCSPACNWCAGFMGAVTPPPNRDERLQQVRQLMALVEQRMYTPGGGCIGGLPRVCSGAVRPASGACSGAEIRGAPQAASPGLQGPLS